MVEVNPVQRDGGALYELIMLWPEEESLFLIGALLLESPSCGIAVERRSDELITNTNLVLAMLKDQERCLDKWQKLRDCAEVSFSTIGSHDRSGLFWVETKADSALLTITRAVIAWLEGNWHGARFMLFEACHLIECYRAEIACHPLRMSPESSSLLRDERTAEKVAAAVASAHRDAEIKRISSEVYEEQKRAISALKAKWLNGDKRKQ